MRILVYEGHVDTHTAKEANVEVVSMESLLQQSDFISIHAALTPETRHLIGLDEFKKMDLKEMEEMKMYGFILKFLISGKLKDF